MKVSARSLVAVGVCLALPAVAATSEEALAALKQLPGLASIAAGQLVPEGQAFKVPVPDSPLNLWVFQGSDRSWHGALLPVPVAVSSGKRMRPRDGLEVSQEVVAPHNLLRADGVRVTSPLWSLAYEMRKASTDEAAVVAFDMAAFNELVSIAELAEFTESDLPARQGVERVRRVMTLLDENAWSPMEPLGGAIVVSISSRAALRAVAAPSLPCSSTTCAYAKRSNERSVPA